MKANLCPACFLGIAIILAMRFDASTQEVILLRQTYQKKTSLNITFRNYLKKEGIPGISFIMTERIIVVIPIAPTFFLFLFRK